MTKKFLPLLALASAFCFPSLSEAVSYQVDYPPSATPGELTLGVSYRLWVADTTTQIRGIIVHQHGCGEGACRGGATAADDLHWQALAKKWDCALLGPSYQQSEKDNCRLWCDPRNGSDATFLKALQDFATKSNHPELEKVPWCLWGHSGGGFWSSIMQTLHPERIVAIWFRSGTAFSYWEKGEITKPVIPKEAYGIPMAMNPGTKENGDKRFNGAWEGTLSMFKAYRAEGAPALFAPDPNTSHQCGDSRYLAIPFFDACLAQRLPAKNATDQKLRSVDLKKAFYAPLLGDTFAKQTPEGEVSNWLPNEAFAKAWSEYVKTGATSDTTPPPRPFGLKVTTTPDGHTLTWEAEADFESGLAGFIIERDGAEIARIPEKPTSPYGRPLFQVMSYGDTPETKQGPVPQMWFIDKIAGLTHPVYRIKAINSVGLESEAATDSLAGAKRFLCTDYAGGKVCLVNTKGEIEWQTFAKSPQDCWLLPNGNILFCHVGGAVEMTRDHTIVWEYIAPQNVECHACQPLPSGMVLVVEGGTKRIIEVDRQGQVAKEIPLPTTVTNTHNQFRGTRKLASGNYLVACKGESKVIEVTSEGKTVREIPVTGDPHEALPLPNGNILITCGDGHNVVEVAPDGKTVWELNENDIPGTPLRLMAGANRLPNGNTVFCVYLGHGHLGGQPQFMEITPDKKVVWQFDDHTHFRTINQIQVLDLPSDPEHPSIR
ncbi:MAG: hypothetical protein WCO60_10335 [Verrucomicrobiota bacterium]